MAQCFESNTGVKYIYLICSGKSRTVTDRAGVQNEIDHSLACCHTRSILIRACLCCLGILFSQVQRHLLSWGSLSVKNQIGC